MLKVDIRQSIHAYDTQVEKFNHIPKVMALKNAINRVIKGKKPLSVDNKINTRRGYYNGL